MGQRYDIEKDPDGLWRIIDRFTGLVVVEKEGVTLDGLFIEDADDLLDLLNRRDIMDRRAKGMD